ncbi:class II aldolase/adducin family protein [Anaerocolumna sp.]|uniref:class II aldolase/adducin family protein n=1 Tax=Anaerocolumna sp. TaxID=2041569 RepID=UPI0028A5E64B|nr:class II aldolase/adducin family protein [Anaerocolumna sp.]
MMTIQGKRYPSDFEAKKAILEIGKRMYMKGFVAANDGNISCKVGPNIIWTTPTGVSKGFMTMDMLVKMDFNGEILAGNRKPSSEVKMHLRVYEENPEVMAVTHAHPPVATSFAIAGISLDRPILPEAIVQLGSVPIAHYATPGTQEVPDSIAPFCKTHNGVLLANHGALSWGRDVFEAFFRLESIEYYATVLMYTGQIIGKQNELSCDQVNELINTRKKLGINTGGIPNCSTRTTNTQDVLSSEPLQTEQVMGISQIQPQSQPQTHLSGVTPLVSPGAPSQDTGCGCGGTVIAPKEQATMTNKTKEEIIAEVVRRVTEEVAKL